MTAIDLCNSSHFSLTFSLLQYLINEDYFENMKLDLLWLHQLEISSLIPGSSKYLTHNVCEWSASSVWQVGTLRGSP